MFFSFIEIEKGGKGIFALDSVSVQEKPKACYKNIPINEIPEGIRGEIFELKDGILSIKSDAFLDAWSGVVRFLFNRAAYDSGDYANSIVLNIDAWTDPELARAKRRALIRGAIESNISLASEIKGLRADIKRLYDELRIPYSVNMTRFESMIQKIKKHYPKENLNQYLPKKENFEE